MHSIFCKSNQIKSNLSLYSLYYAEACNELAGPISASLRPGNTAPFEEMASPTLKLSLPIFFSLSQNIKSNFRLYSLYDAETCNKLRGPSRVIAPAANTVPFQDMSQYWRAVGNTVFDLTGPTYKS